jgi:hypothetical protein
MRNPLLDRRRFVGTLAAAALAPSLARAQPPSATLELHPGAPGPTIPANFTGLSYESAQLANPDFFSPRNTELIDLFRQLSPSGNLRLGGGSSGFTSYSDADPTAPPPFEVFGPDTSKTVKHGTTTTALALRNLRGFLDASNWSCLYGLNLGPGTKENAAAEAAAAFRILGPRLLAFQIGNELDSFRNRYRPASYSPADFIAEWNTFHDAIVALTPNAKFARPDISNKQAFLTAFAAEAPRHPDVILLTGHYYAMGPASNPNATLDQLFEREPKLAAMHQHNLEDVFAAIRTKLLLGWRQAGSLGHPRLRPLVRGHDALLRPVRLGRRQPARGAATASTRPSPAHLPPASPAGRSSSASSSPRRSPAHASSGVPSPARPRTSPPTPWIAMAISELPSLTGNLTLCLSPFPQSRTRP